MRRRFFRRPHQRPKEPTTRVNEQIRITPVRLIDETGQQLGVVSNEQALQMARERELDLVEIVANVRPPVVKIMDFDKYRYQKAKEEQTQKTKQKKTEIKGIRIGLRTDEHDLDVRRKQADKFLSQSNKVKIEIILRGREKAHRELAKDILDKFEKTIATPHKVEQEIKKHPSGFNIIIAPS